MGKDSTPKKKSKKSSEKKKAMDTEEKVYHTNEIAQPLAPLPLSKKILKLNKKAAKEKALKRGVKEVIKSIKKNEKGVCIIAGDITPLDVITHLPVLCEEANIHYVYVPSKEELGASSGCKRPTSCVLISPKKDSKLNSKLQALETEIKALPVPLHVA
ncbi:snoRNA-binding protein [Balamuthia mandrillaris]